MVIPDGIKNITFTDEVKAVNDAAADLKKKGIKAIAVLAHMSAEQNGSAITGESAKLASGTDLGEYGDCFNSFFLQVSGGVIDGLYLIRKRNIFNSVRDDHACRRSGYNPDTVRGQAVMTAKISRSSAQTVN